MSMTVDSGLWNNEVRRLKVECCTSWASPSMIDLPSITSQRPLAHVRMHPKAHRSRVTTFARRLFLNLLVQSINVRSNPDIPARAGPSPISTSPPPATNAGTPAASPSLPPSLPLNPAPVEAYGSKCLIDANVPTWSGATTRHQTPHISQPSTLASDHPNKSHRIRNQR